MAKLPAIQFYTGDWLKDANLSKCLPATRGIWIDALCAMHESDRSESISGTPEQLSRVLRCSPADVSAAADDLKATGTANVTIRNGLVTLTCRRFQREKKQRVMTLNRVRKVRCNADETILKRGCNAPSSSTSSISSSDNDDLGGGSEVQKRVRVWFKEHPILIWNAKHEGLILAMVEMGGWNAMALDVQAAIEHTKGRKGTVEYAEAIMRNRLTENSLKKSKGPKPLTKVVNYDI